jgi:phosphatidylinositol alpha-1,6-mannosyltransferase
VLCGNWYPEGLLCLLARVPYALLAHGAELCPPQSRIARPWCAIAQRTLLRAEWVIANSQYTAGLVKSLASRSRVRALPLPVDTSKFTPGSVHEARHALGLPQDARIITTVSRVEPFKGHDTVLRALGALREAEREDIRYLIVGTGPHLGELEELTQSLGLGRQVEIRGHVSETELRHVYHAADAYVMCTRDESAERRVEGYGLAFLEAQASGTPVIAARTGGIPDAVAPLGHNRLIDPLDTAMLGRELAALPRKTEAMSEALRAWVLQERHEAKYWRELRGLLAPLPLGADCASLHFEKV